MIDPRKIWPSRISRRSLLQSAGCGIGAAAILGVTMRTASASKMPQSAVGYQATPKGAQRCDNCTLWQAPNACKSVDGNISPQGWCRIYVKAS